MKTLAVSQDKYIYYLAHIVLFGALALILLVFLLTQDDVSLMIGLALCPLIIIFLPQLIQTFQGNSSPDLLNPLNFIAFTTLIGVTLRTPFMVSNLGSDYIRNYMLLGKSHIILWAGLAVINVGLLAFMMGYVLKVQPINLHRLSIFNRDNWPQKRMTIITIALLIIGLISIYIFIDRLGIANSLLASSKRRLEIEGANNYQWSALGYLRWGAKLIAYAFYFSFAFQLSQRKKLFSFWGILTLSLALMAMAFSVIVGSRTNALIVVVYGIFIFHYSYRRIPGWVMPAMAAAVFATAVLLGALRFASQNDADVATYFNVLETGEAFLINRSWLDISKTSHIVTGIPESLDFQNGRTMVTWLLAPIPRTIWEDKPMIRVGPFIGGVLFNQQLDRSGVTPGFMGELYLNFGWVGVIVGMFLFGLVLKTLYISFIPLIPQNKNALLVYMLTMFPLAYQLLGGDFSGVMIVVLISLVTTGLFLLLINFRTKM